MIQNYFQNVKRFSGSSFVSPAYGWSGTRATINYNSPAAEKNSGEARKQAGKKEGGLGEGIFARLLSAEGGMGWESVSAIPASAGRQNRNIFVSLIEKNFGGARIKKCKENFSVLLAVRRTGRRTETLGGIQSAKSSGFCSKWVRISSNKHHFFIKNGTVEKNTLYYLDCRNYCYAWFLLRFPLPSLLHSGIGNQGYGSGSNLGRASNNCSRIRTDCFRSHLGNTGR